MSKIALTPNATGTGVFTISSPATNTDRTLTLPDEAGTVLTSASSLASDNLTGTVTVIGGNVGIGTSSPVAKNHLRGSGTSGQVTASWMLENYSSGTAGMDIIGSAGASRWRFSYGGGPSTGTNTLSEAMCILTEGASSGNVGIGTSSPAAELHVMGQIRCETTNPTAMYIYGSAGITPALKINEYGVRDWDISAGQYSSGTFSIRSSSLNGVYLGGTATSWASASDERLKDIIEPISNAANKVSTLRAVIGKYKTDEEGTRRSFLIAQDVQAVLPEAVESSNPDMLGVQYTDVIPLLVAALQEALTEISALKVRVAALEAV
jgi:hypothetical protein